MKSIIAGIIAFIITFVILTFLFGCTVAGKTSNEGKFVEKANINTQAALSRVDDLETPAATYQLNRIRLGEGSQLSIHFPEAKEPLKRSRRVVETISNNSKAAGKSSWFVTEVDGLYYICLGFCCLLVAIATLVGLVAWRLAKAKFTGGASEFASAIETMALNGLKHFTPKTPEWSYAENLGEAVKIGKAKLRIK